ncbi:MAG TPA: S24 family peptidase [Stellaceae bacterium]|nr:S24 family peptidase [Stellaceae bacterium]
MPKDFLRAATDAAEGQIRIMTVVGDSMETTFRPYERIMVDVSDRQPSPPGIFVLFDGVGHVVKRVELVVGSNPPRVRISADNPRYSVYESALDEAGIEGRVLGKWQWV